MESKKRPLVLLATTVSWPLSTRLAIRLIGYGSRVVAVCPPWHPLTHVRGIARIYPYRGLSSLASFETAIRSERPDLIVPCDDRVVWQMHELYERRADLRPLIEASLGPATGYGIVSHRDQLLDTARALGIRVPDTRQVTSEDDVARWFADVSSSAALKADGTSGGDGVQIVRSQAQGIAAFHKLSQRPGLATVFKRLIVNRDPLALWEWRKHAPRLISIQRIIEGRPATAMLACWRGELLGVLAVEVLSSQGATGAALVVRVLDNEEITTAARRLTGHLKLTGFYGLDFMLETKTGFPYLIEMNPRSTQLGHLSLTDRGDLVGLLFAKLAGQSEPPRQERIGTDVIAFFPQTLVWNPSSPFIRTGYHDVPWEEPALVRELLREPWPDRQWSGRLYRHLSPPRRTSAVEFEDRNPGGLEDREVARPKSRSG